MFLELKEVEDSVGVDIVRPLGWVPTRMMEEKGIGIRHLSKFPTPTSGLSGVTTQVLTSFERVSRGTVYGRS